MHLRSTRRVGLIALVVALVAASCGDDGAGTTSTTPAATTSAPVAASSSTTAAAPTTTEPAPVTAASDDGRVSMEVPAGAGEEISITLLGTGEHPDDLASLDVEPWVYALEPADLRFDDPFPVTVEIPFAEFGAPDGHDDSIPLAMLVVTGGDGTGWEPVGDPVIRRDGDTVILSGTIDHFSRLAAIPEQVFIETRLVETSTDGTNTFGVGFTWSNGARLEAPAARSASFRTGGAGASQLPATFEEGMLSVQCPSGAASLFGDASLNLLLDAVDGTTGETGLVSTPRLTTADQMQATLDIGLELACRPTIAEDGSVRMEIRVDHPGGEEIVPNQDFRGGLSAMLLVLARGFPGLYAGLIRDVNSNGMIDPEDLMYPPFPATADGDTTSVVLPLFGYGDYFPYLIDGQPPQIETQITVADGGTILLGGLTREQTSVPFLGGVPYLARVFSEESSQSDEVELLIFLTPQIVESDR